MPLPSTIAGLIGAILGIRRKFLIEFVKQKDMHCGAELIGFDGYISEYVRFFKFPKKIFYASIKAYILTYQRR